MTDVLILLSFDFAYRSGSVKLTLPAWFLGLVILAFAVLILLLWAAKHKQDPKLELWNDDEFSLNPTQLAGLTHSTVLDGNRAEILENGVFFDRLAEDLEQAKSTIHFETFLWRGGRAATRLSEILAKQAKAGLKVRMMLDGSGASVERKQRAALVEAGCMIRSYNAPKRLRGIGRINNRDHRKIVVIDGKIGYVGGHCVTDYWLGDASSREEFRDVSLRVDGPIVHQIQSAFIDNWIEEAGDVSGGDGVFPELVPTGELKAHLAYISPQGRTSTLKLLHYAVISGAKKRIRIQNPYFLPDPDAIRLLERAVARGVDVQVMLPSVEATDSPFVQHASHHRFGALLKAGLRIWEYEKTLLHQKVMTIDGEWVSIGSTNFDDRSFELNDEVTLGVPDRGMAARFEEIFEGDRKFAREVTLEGYRSRSVPHRIIDFTMFLMNEQL